LKLKITITMEAAEDVTADQVKDTFVEGDCGDFDKLVAELIKVKVKEVAEDEALD
jgi:hypothetical protein